MTSEILRCGMIVDYKCTPDGERGDEIDCGKPATHRTPDGYYLVHFCAEHAAERLADPGLGPLVALAVTQ